MSETNKSRCRFGCWTLAAIIGLLTLVLLLVLGGYSWPASIFLGALTFIGLGLLFTWLFCGADPAASDRTGGVLGAATAGAAGAAAVAGGAASAAGSAAKGASDKAGDAASAAAGAAGNAASSAAGAAKGAASKAGDVAEGAADAAKGAASAAADTASDAADTAKSAASGAADAAGDAANAAKGAASGAADAAADAAGSAADAAKDAASGAADAASDAAGSAAAAVTPSKALDGEAELAGRKGEWKYEGGSDTAEGSASGATVGDVDGDGDVDAADAKAAAKIGDVDGDGDVDAADAAKAEEIESTPDYDGDGKKEGSDEGVRPAGLTAAREGGADNLKEIKGVGPKLEKLLNSLGFYHFDQVAAWSADEIAWVNANLAGFKGRVTRDNWVEQAKILASGGETEFSKRVEDGDVY